MFSKSSKSAKGPVAKETPPAPPQKQLAPSIISADLRIVGDLNSDGEIQVDGAVDGDIRTKVLLIGESATVKGEIIAQTARVYGTINGQIKARSVTLAKSAHVTGDILHENLSIEEGAFLEGHCKRMTEQKEAPEGKINLVVKDPAAPVTSPDPSKNDDTKKRLIGS